MYVSGGQGPDGKRTWHNIREAAGQTRPTLLETVYGLDVIIPGKPLGSCDVSHTKILQACIDCIDGQPTLHWQRLFQCTRFLQTLGHLHARTHEHHVLLATCS